jgi:hypothetical protein
MDGSRSMVGVKLKLGFGRNRVEWGDFVDEFRWKRGIAMAVDRWDVMVSKLLVL